VSRAARGVVEAAARLLAAFGPAAVCGAGFVGLMGAVSLRLPPRPADRQLEVIIVREQLRRSTVIRPQLLILGDSAALMGVDVRRLGQELQLRVESLATLGWVGPAGYAQLLEAVAERAGPPTWVLVLLCGNSLSLSEEQFAQAGFESRVLAGSASVDEATGASTRDRIYERLFSPLLDPPLPGRYGFYYGWPADIAATLQRGNGSMVDPSISNTAALPPTYRFEISPAVAGRLRVLGRALHPVSAGRRLFGIMPLPQTAVGQDSDATRRKALSQASLTLDLPRDSILDLPLALPHTKFASLTHLNATGREAFTAMLSQAIRQRIEAASVASTERTRATRAQLTERLDQVAVPPRTRAPSAVPRRRDPRLPRGRGSARSS